MTATAGVQTVIHITEQGIHYDDFVAPIMDHLLLGPDFNMAAYLTICPKGNCFIGEELLPFQLQVKGQSPHEAAQVQPCHECVIYGEVVRPVPQRVAVLESAGLPTGWSYGWICPGPHESVSANLGG